ncbi:MAG: response regulator [Deltaproteobacteria bacterium]|nr:response regulator [Deltaproteobacteria bacterium]
MAGLKILVIEDDQFFQQYVNDLLQGFDVELVNAMDGEEGLLLAQSVEPDLILTDIEIPKIQGFVLLNQLKEMPQTADVPVILMSGKVERDLLDKHSRLSVHADGYLLKPFSLAELHGAITRVMGTDALAAFKAPVDTPTERSLPEAPIPVQNPPLEGVGIQKRSKPLVLVVDDSTYVLTQAGDLLKNAGLDVDVATDGDAGLAKCLEVRPDIVLLDVQMPKRNGFAVCETLKKNPDTRTIPIILMSAVVDGDSFERHSKLKYHADAYLQKPFKRAELLDLVFGHLAMDAVPDGVQDKTAFVLQEEGEFADGQSVKEGRLAGRLAENERRLQEAIRSLESYRSREKALLEEIDNLRRDNDQLGEERKEELRQRDDRRRQLVERATLAARRAEEAVRGAEEIKNSNLKLKMDLEAALTAKAEIEEQAKAVVEGMKKSMGGESLGDDLARLGRENIELGSRLAEAEAGAAGLVKLQSDLEQVREENRELRESISSMSDRTELMEEIADFKEQLNLANTRVAAGNEERLGLQSTIDLLNIEKEKIREEGARTAEKIAETLRKEVDSLRMAAKEAEEMRALNGKLRAEAEKLRRSSAVLSESLEHEREKRSIAQKEAEFARKELEGAQEERKRAAALKRELEEKKDRLETLQAQSRILEKENRLFQERLQASVQSGGVPLQMGQAGGQEDLLSNRLNQLEQVLRRTVGDAQTALMDQKGKEKGLEEKINTLVNTLEAERVEHGKDREEWRSREIDLKKSMEDFFEERSRLMGEELSRLYPIPAARTQRPLEVVRPGRRFGSFALIGLLLLIALLLGYLVASRLPERKLPAGHGRVQGQTMILPHGPGRLGPGPGPG